LFETISITFLQGGRKNLQGGEALLRPTPWLRACWTLQQSRLFAWLLPQLSTVVLSVVISTYSPTDAHRFLIAAVVFMLPAFYVRILI